MSIDSVDNISFKNAIGMLESTSKRFALNVFLGGLPVICEAFKNIRENDRMLSKNFTSAEREVANAPDDEIWNAGIDESRCATIRLIEAHSNYFRKAGIIGFVYLIGIAVLLTGLFAHIPYAKPMVYAGGSLAGAAFLFGAYCTRKMSLAHSQIRPSHKEEPSPSPAAPPVTTTNPAHLDDSVPVHYLWDDEGNRIEDGEDE